MMKISPLYYKELIQLSSSKKSFIYKTLYLWCLIIISVFIIYSYGFQNNYNSDTSYIGKKLFISIVALLFVTMTIFPPILTAGVISGERHANTLSLLFITRLSNWQIVQDKALAQFTFLIYILCTTLPVMTIVMLFGGVDIAQIILALLYLLGFGIFNCGMTLYFSSIRDTYLSAFFSWLVYSILLHTAVLMPMDALDLEGLYILHPIGVFEVARSGFSSQSTFCAFVLFLFSILSYYLFLVFADHALLREKKEKTEIIEADEPGINLNLSQKIRLPSIKFSDYLEPRFWSVKDYFSTIFRNLKKYRIFLYVASPMLFLPFTLLFSRNSRNLFYDPKFIFQIYFYILPLTLVFIMFRSISCFSAEWHTSRMSLLLTTQLKGKHFINGAILSILKLFLIPLILLSCLLSYAGILQLFGFGRNISNANYVLAAFSFTR
ncbi:MAG: hypothetical protein HRT89_09775 [Lentisphaeria bacterium]|nr:hypothetical protein [Lentisphaeria bacterium]NQZ68348.1 hypothetical protein [Lentisphaeria bacterium]